MPMRRTPAPESVTAHADVTVGCAGAGMTAPGTADAGGAEVSSCATVALAAVLAVSTGDFSVTRHPKVPPTIAAAMPIRMHVRALGPELIDAAPIRCRNLPSERCAHRIHPGEPTIPTGRCRSGCNWCRRIEHHLVVQHELLTLEEVVVVLGVVACALVLLAGEALDRVERLPDRGEQILRDAIRGAAQHAHAPIPRRGRVLRLSPPHGDRGLR